MKKKFINGLLMVALFVGFTSSMVSCKDYDDEKITNLEGVLADNVAALKKALADQKADLETQINNVNLLIQACQKNCQAFQQEIRQKLNDYYTKKQTDSLDNILLNEIINRTSKEAVAKTVAELLNEGKNVMTTALDAYITNYNNINGIINEDSIRKILQAEVIKLNAAIDQVRALAQSGLDLAKADSVRIDGLDALVAGLQGDVKTLRSDLDAIIPVANNAWAKAQANEIAINKLDSCYKALDQKVDEQYTELKGLIQTNANEIARLDRDKADKTYVDSLYQDLLTKIGNVDADLQEYKAKVDAALKDIQEDIDDLYAAVFGLADYLTKQITSIEINGTYNPMFGELATPFNVRSNMLVAFRGTIEDRLLNFPSRNSDFYAFGGDPTTIFTNKDLEMLGVTSPSELNGYFEIAKPQDIVANEVFDKNGKVVPTEDQGYAGTIYLTINPTNRDFEGTQFDLYNSQNKKVVADLSPLKKSDHLLTFGYTRAAIDEESENGFYETKVTVTPENAKELGLRLNLDELKPVAENLKNWKDGINLTPLVNAIYDNINNLLDASALKATWKVGDEEDAESFSVLSQYAIGVAGVKPLSFAFGKDIILDGIPGTDLAEDLLHNIIDVVVEGLPEMDFINRFDIKELRLDEITDDLYAVITVDLGDRHIESTGPKTATFWFPYYEITGTNGEYVLMTNTHPEVTVTVTGGGDENGEATIQVKLYMGDFIARMGDYDTENYDNIKKQFNQLLDQINSFVSSITQMNFTTMGDNVFAQFQNFIDELNDHFVRFTHPNRFFQPAVVVKNEKGMVHLSKLPNYPTKVEAPIAIIPTNFNAEILSPAFKKFIAVTDVIKDGKSAKEGNVDCKNVLVAANKTAGLNQVINGGFNPIAFTGKAGYTYEFLYTAVDYSGLIVTKKFYLTVK